MIASGADRSCAHKNDSPRNWMQDGKNLNIANNIGIINNIGKHPLIGFAPALLYSSIVF